MLARQKARVALLPLVEAFEARKRAAGAIDYADQVAYAARIAVASAEVGRRERRAGRSCCSTSTRTPASVSCACSRRCSAATPGTRCSPWAIRASRSTAGAVPPRARSNGSRARSPGCPAAGRAAHPGHELAQRPRPCSRWPTPSPAMLPAAGQPLPDLAAAPTAGAGSVSVGLYETVAEETAALADRLAACWRGEDPPRRRGRRSAPDRGGAGAGAQAAARDRRRPARARACRSRWSGSAGCSRCPRSPTSSPRSRCWSTRPPATRCGRLLTGARWRIGPRDLAALESRARALVARPPARPGRRRRAPRPPRADRCRRSAAASSRRSTTSAAPRRTRRGHRRLRRLARRAGPRCAPGWASRCPTWSTRSPGPSVWRPSWPARPSASPAGARAHLDALHGVAAEFTELAELPVAPGVPRLPARRRRARARPGAGRGRGQPGGGPAAHRALGQGPGVGRRRRARA